jgi:HAD superfamily hydrolase (TIGR01509 family)
VTTHLRPGVLFDVDGTLLDTNYLHALAWSRALRDAGEWAPMNAIHRLVGMGGDQLLLRLLGRPSPEAVAARPSHYQALTGDIRPFPGAAELLRHVHEHGLVVVLATSAPDDELKILRQVLGADDAIDGQTSADDISASKPSPEVFLTAMRTYSIDARRALAVGDSIWDVQAARAAGIGCLTVESGGFSQHELSEAGARHVYRDMQELLDQVFTSALAQLFPSRGFGADEPKLAEWTAGVPAPRS